MARHILHVDLDEFVAAVEILRRPELRDIPVVVGGCGDPTKRGVVSTANYVAREFGVHSGMPLRTAARRCPDAVFLAVDRNAYDQASQKVMQVLSEFGDALEIWGWDEAFLSVPGNPEKTARNIRQAIRQRTRLSCAIGIGDNKLQAKTATEFAKPGGIHRLTSDAWFDVMGARPPSALWGIGKKTARRLAELGIESVEQLSQTDDADLAAVFGPRTGPWLASVARGEGSAHVSSEPRRAKSRGMERTFDEDVDDVAAVANAVEGMAHELADILARDDRLAKGVTVKIRFAPFFTHNKRVRLDEPSSEGKAISTGALRALEQLEIDRPVRLVGVRADLI